MYTYSNNTSKITKIKSTRQMGKNRSVTRMSDKLASLQDVSKYFEICLNN